MPWPKKIYTDGSGLAPQVPEARRCGWAAVALGADGWPYRVIYGALPGQLQTVGRAERYAVLAPLRQGGEVELVVSDLQSLVREGNEWSAEAESARGRHAGLWRKIRGAVANSGRAPPRFRWVPAHKTLQEALEGGLSPLDWLGNCWADFFAGLGAASGKIADSHVELMKDRMQGAVAAARYVGWAAARVARLDLWRPLDGDGKLVRKIRAPTLRAKPLVLTRHQYQPITHATKGDGVQCVCCGREAYSAKAKEQLDHRDCVVSELGLARASMCSGGEHVASSPAVAAALAAAAALAGAAAGGAVTQGGAAGGGPRVRSRSPQGDPGRRDSKESNGFSPPA